MELVDLGGNDNVPESTTSRPPTEEGTTTRAIDFTATYLLIVDENAGSIDHPLVVGENESPATDLALETESNIRLEKYF